MQKVQRPLLQAQPKLTLENMKAVQEFYQLLLLLVPDLGQEQRTNLVMTLVKGCMGIDLEQMPNQSKKYEQGNNEQLWTAPELGEEFGVGRQMVGWVANRHGLKTRAYGKSRTVKSCYSDCLVEQFCYNERGRARLAELINSRLVD